MLKKSSYKGGFADSWVEQLPSSTRTRLEKAGVDLSQGYPERPPTEDIPIFLGQAEAIRNTATPYIERGKNVDHEKKALLGAAKEVKNLTKHIGTEILGLQLKDKRSGWITERVVVFFRDQDLSPHKQLELGSYWGTVEKHSQQIHVPELHGITVTWQDLYRKNDLDISFKNVTGHGTNIWHTDLTHELQPPGITHLHNDAIPDVGGDTVWSSG